LLYAIVGAALTMPNVAKVSWAGIDSLRPINLTLSRALDNPRGAKREASIDPADAENFDSAKSDEGRFLSVRAELLPTLPTGRSHAATDRHFDLPPRLPVHLAIVKRVRDRKSNVRDENCCAGHRRSSNVETQKQTAFDFGPSGPSLRSPTASALTGDLALPARRSRIGPRRGVEN
jgi:hypothetical protein